MRGADECPRCGSSKVAKIRLPGAGWHHGCMESGCSTLWEPFAVEDLMFAEEEFSSFKTPCNNCAFRKDSPERNDPDKWAALMSQFETGMTVFYCHKGVPLSQEEGESHEHPKNPDGTWDKSRMRMCRGFVNMEHGAARKALRQIYGAKENA